MGINPNGCPYVLRACRLLRIFSLLSYRLATNYKADEGSIQPYRFVEIYSRCERFFASRDILPPTKDLVGKLIPVLFKTPRCIVYSGGEQYVAYRGLSAREHTVNTNGLNIPGSCSVTTNSCNELNIACCREHIIDGQQLQLSVTFGKASTSVNIRDTQFSLGFILEPVQGNVDGMVLVLEQLRVCKGYQTTESETSNSLTEKWTSVLHQDQYDVRVRSPGCKQLMSLYSKVDHCQVCIEKFKRAKKREGSLPEKVNPQQKVRKCDKAPLRDLTNEADTLKAGQNEETGKTMSEAIDELLSAGAPEKFKIFLEMQLENSKTDMDIRQRKWDPEFISFCLGIYVKSPRIYRDLRDSRMLVLPSESLLRMYKNCIQQKPGINNENLTWMKKEAIRQSVSSFGYRGGLVIDEMAIQDELQIVRRGDAWSIVGGVDMGEVNNAIAILTNKHKKIELATHCLQFLFHGFCGFRWPVAYYGSNPASTHQLFNTFWDCVDALDEQGFRVDYIMLDGASTNRAFTNMLLPKDPRSARYTATNMFDNSKKIYVIQDIKHVIKKIRNNFEASKQVHKAAAGRYLVLNGMPIVWDHVESAFKFNTQSGFRIHRRLTKEHVELTGSTKMRNKLAEQVLDNDMLFLMKSYQATLDKPELLSSTITFLENTSALVEIFNDRRPISDTSDRRLAKLDGVRKFFNDWEADVSKSVLYSTSKHLLTQETREDINSSLLGFAAMCDGLLGKGDSITPSFINSDIVENHFCQQRGTCNGLNTNPTLAQYGPSNTSICLSQSSVSSKANSGVKAENFKATTPCALNKRRNSKTSCIRV